MEEPAPIGIANISLARALRDRFETDRLLGVQSLPVSISIGPKSRSAPTRIAPLRPTIDAAEVQQRVHQLSVIDNQEVKGCTHCGLHTSRTNTVFGVGSPNARIVFVGEAPGADEDASGIPFVGKAGQLLTDMIEKGMRLNRDEVYICNVLKCRPPNNRTPAPDEIHACCDYLLRQIQIIQPEVIIALGAPAAQTLLRTKDGIGRLRSRWHDFYPSGAAGVGPSIPVMPTFHPAYLLRSPGEKGKSWEDLKLVMQRLNIPIQAKG